MKFNKWTMGLAAVGVVSLASAARADETPMSQVQTALSSTTLSGYVDTSAQWNLGSQNGGITPPYRFGGIGKADGFNLNAVDLALDRPMDESPWAAGYRVELMLGPDAVPGPGIRQAYLALRTPVGNSGIDWKVGVWDSILGYESTSDPLDPNYTRSYGYTMEPTTFTGILGTYKVNDMVSVSAGVADASQVLLGGFAVGPAPINGRNVQESKKAYMGSITFTAPDSAGFMKGATMTAGVINNDGGSTATGPGGFGTWGTTSLYAGATVPTPLSALKAGVAFDWLDIHDSHAFGSSDSSAWNVGVYANYQVNDKLSFNARAEHFALNANNGAFGGGGFGIAGGLAAARAADEFTATVQYALWANVLSRVEFRWDHTEHGQPYDSTSYGAGMSQLGVHDNAYLLALNLIYQF